MKQIKHIYLIFFIFLFSVIFFSCDEINNVNDPSKNYTFLCMLKNDQVIQKAYLYNALDLKESMYSYSSNDAFVHNAEIIMSNGTISSQLKVRQFQYYPPYLMFDYIYSDDSVFRGKILPNTKYDIQIKINDEIITGSTIVPGEFSVNIPLNNTIELGKDANKEEMKNYTLYKYRLSWSKSANSASYVVFSTITYKNALGEFRDYYGQSVNSVDTFAIMNIPENYGSLSYGTEYAADSAKFVVIAVDKNYHDYYFLSRDRAGISSHYGVFGSSIVDSCVVQIKYQDD
jgi:hypothetical protein